MNLNSVVIIVQRTFQMVHQTILFIMEELLRKYIVKNFNWENVEILGYNVDGATCCVRYKINDCINYFKIFRKISACCCRNLCSKNCLCFSRLHSINSLCVAVINIYHNTNWRFYWFFGVSLYP